MYIAKWAERYKYKKNAKELAGLTSSDRFFEYVLNRIWGVIKVETLEKDFEDSLAREYLIESDLLRQVTRVLEVDEAGEKERK